MLNRSSKNENFFDFGVGLISVIKKIKLCLMVSIDSVEGRNIFFTTAWVSQIFSMTDSRLVGMFFKLLIREGSEMENL
jgi:hypothetical protein